MPAPWEDWHPHPFVLLAQTHFIICSYIMYCFIFHEPISPFIRKHKRGETLPATMEKLLAVVLGMINCVCGDIFEFPQSYIPLHLTCIGSKCGRSNTDHALQCRLNNTCKAIFWEEYDTCYFCRCQAESLQATPLDAHFGRKSQLRKPFDKLPGKLLLIHQQCIQVFVSIKWRNHYMCDYV